MASQIGTTRVYTDPSEAGSSRKVTCGKCGVMVVPKGISDTRNTAQGTHCPNCGHVFGRDNH